MRDNRMRGRTRRCMRDSKGSEIRKLCTCIQLLLVSILSKHVITRVSLFNALTQPLLAFIHMVLIINSRNESAVNSMLKPFSLKLIFSKTDLLCNGSSL